MFEIGTLFFCFDICLHSQCCLLFHTHHTTGPKDNLEFLFTCITLWWLWKTAFGIKIFQIAAAPSLLYLSSILHTSSEILSFNSHHQYPATLHYIILCEYIINSLTLGFLSLASVLLLNLKPLHPRNTKIISRVISKNSLSLNSSSSVHSYSQFLFMVPYLQRIQRRILSFAFMAFKSMFYLPFLTYLPGYARGTTSC